MPTGIILWCDGIRLNVPQVQITALRKLSSPSSFHTILFHTISLYAQYIRAVPKRELIFETQMGLGFWCFVSKCKRYMSDCFTSFIVNIRMELELIFRQSRGRFMTKFSRGLWRANDLNLKSKHSLLCEAYAIFNHQTWSSKLQKKNKTLFDRKRRDYYMGEDEKYQYGVVSELSRANKT